MTVLDGKYEILRKLGEGGMGAVYEARHLGTGRRVAVKMIKAQALATGAEVITRFHREARASGAIESEHVVDVLDTGVDDSTGGPYMVMELLQGEDMQQLLARTGPLVPDAALRVLAQACVGLRKAHEADIVHRDLKSANLFLARRDSGELVVKLLDFGIAKVRADQLAPGSDHGLTRTGSMMGSPLYMSPEQARGSKDLDQRADIWSLGIVLYEALAGITPYGECSTLGEIIVAICTTEPPAIQDRAPWVPAAVAEIVRRALAPDPAARFQSAAEMHAAITALLPHGTVVTDAIMQPLPGELRRRTALRLVAADTAHGHAVGSVTAPTSGQLERRSTRPGRLWIIAVVAVVVAGAGITTYIAQRNPTTEPVSEAVSPPPSTPAPAAPPTPPKPALHTVSIAIAPSDATARVDGTDAAARDGKVDVSGAIGSVHHVELSQAGRVTSVDVVIAVSGPVPARVELPAPAAAPPTTHAAHKAAPTPTAHTVPAPNPHHEGKTPPQIDRSFN